jgi:hypothetical protein
MGKLVLISDVPSTKSKSFKQNAEAFEQALHQFYWSIRKAKDLYSIWCLDDVRDFTKVAYKGKVQLVRSVVRDWGREVSCELTNPTFLDLWVNTDFLIYKSGDWHHVMIEGYRRKGNKLFILTGS